MRSFTPVAGTLHLGYPKRIFWTQRLNGEMVPVGDDLTMAPHPVLYYVDIWIRQQIGLQLSVIGIDVTEEIRNV